MFHYSKNRHMRTLNLADIPFDVVLEDTINGRRVVITRIGGGGTNSMGMFTIKAPSSSLAGLAPKYRYFPTMFLMVRLDRSENNLNCPGGLKVESYGKYNSLGNGSYFVGVHILQNGTRVDFEE